MGIKVANNAYGTLNAGISNVATTLVLNSGEGSRFPTLSAGDYFYATLIDTSNNLEIVKVTARSTDTMTVVRGQDSTTARAYSTNDRFELRPTAALFNEKADAADVTASLATKQAASPVLTTYVDTGVNFRNRIINGDMRIFQRGAAVTTDAQYSVDRWLFVKSNDATESTSQNTDAPSGFVNSLRDTISVGDAVIGASQYSGFEQHIEGFNVSDLGFGTANARSVTLSFWIRSSVTGQYTGNIRNADASRICPFNYTISAANTWEFKTITFAGDTSGTWNTTNGRGITVALYSALGSGVTIGTAGVWNSTSGFGSGSPVNGIASNGNIFAITGVQLEAGSVATPFERRPYGTELALCQRYYQRYDSAPLISSFTTTGGYSVYQDFPLVVTMRSAPTGTTGGTFLYGGGASSYQVNGTYSSHFRGSILMPAYATYAFGYAGTLAFSAEL